MSYCISHSKEDVQNLQPCFADMVFNRRIELWATENDTIHGAQECEHELINRSDDLTHWMCCSKWQRKLSDKLNAKEFAIKVGVRAAELYWCGNHPATIPFDKLPNSYTVKLSNGSGSKQVIPIFNGKDLIRDKFLSENEIKNLLIEMLRYVDDDMNLILIEEYLGSHIDQLPHDYKFFCFHGRVQVLYEYDRKLDTHCWYDKKWNPISDPMHTVRPQGIILPQPLNLPLLIETAEILAKAYIYPFVRIDLYSIKGVPYFGEFTHTPFGNELDFYTSFANRSLGLLWKNPEINFLDISQSI